MKLCPEVHPESGLPCTRLLDHDEDHYVGSNCWPNATSAHALVDLDVPELWTLWTVMKLEARHHVRFDRINAKLTAALEQAGEEVQ